MHWRSFIGSLATGLVVLARGAPAQSIRKVYRIGIFGMAVTSEVMAGPQPRNPSTLAFVRGMRELGYAYGDDFVTEVRGAEGKPERFPRLRC